VGWRLSAVRLGQGHYGDPEQVVVEQPELVALLPVGFVALLPVGFVAQEALEVLEEVALAPFVEQVAVGRPWRVC
jgi:hypothetical protein